MAFQGPRHFIFCRSLPLQKNIRLFSDNIGIKMNILLYMKTLPSIEMFVFFLLNLRQILMGP